MNKIIEKIKNSLFTRCTKSGRITGIKWSSATTKFLFPLLGILAIIWFIIRVVPKPSRIAYPCQQVASSFGFSYLLYLATFFSSFPIFVWIKRKMNKSMAYLFILVLAGGTFIATAIAINNEEKPVQTKFIPNEGPNAPVGFGRGLFAGRVVWVRDTTSTTWDGKNGNWWDDNNTKQPIVSTMFSEMLRAYAGKTNDVDAWNAVFKSYNKSHNRGNKAYKKGEKIVIKINANHDKTSYKWDNEAHTSPAVVYSVVSQLIDVVGVSGNDIIIAEPSQLIGDPIYDKIRSNPNPEYKKIRFADRVKTPAPQRFIPEPDTTSGIYFTIPPKNKIVRFYLPKCYTEATYLINLAILRGHRVFGVTMGAKNHFGSIYCLSMKKYGPGVPGSNAANRPSKNPILHNFSLWDYEDSNTTGEQHCFPTIMAHKDLGGKELIQILDAIYPTRLNENGVIRWQSLDNHWCSSMFISQDPVAIESVGLDIMSNEPNLTEGNPSFTPHLDNGYHEAALANNPPSGFKYDPENNGKFLRKSLGVHEHWNNPVEKKYTGNSIKGKGIELVYLNKNKK